MSRFMMGLQVFVTLVFFSGLRLAAGSTERCQKMMIDKRMKYIVDEKIWTVPDETDAVCKDVMETLRCFNDEAGFDTKSPPNFLLQGDNGFLFKWLAISARNAEEFCTKGGKINNLLHSPCFGKAIKVQEECRLQSLDVFDTFWNNEIKKNTTASINFCLSPLYQGGCVGISVLEECGDEVFATFTDAVIRVYKSFIEFFKMNTMCSSEIVQVMKTSLIKRLNMTESHIRVYRKIFDMDTEKRTPVTPLERTIVTSEQCEEMLNRFTTKYPVNKLVSTLFFRTDALCTEVMEILRCHQDENGFDFKSPPKFLLQSKYGSFFEATARIVNLTEEFCTKDSKIRKLFFSRCFRKAMNAFEECMGTTADDFETFRNSMFKMNITEPIVNFCILPEYVGGCVGAAVLEECGKDSLYTFIDAFRSVYQFTIYMSDVNTSCSSATTQTVKTNFFESLNIPEPQKSVYRVISDSDNGKGKGNNSMIIDIYNGKTNRGNILMNNYCLYLLMIVFIYSTEKHLYVF